MRRTTSARGTLSRRTCAQLCTKGRSPNRDLVTAVIGVSCCVRNRALPLGFVYVRKRLVLRPYSRLRGIAGAAGRARGPSQKCRNTSPSSRRPARFYSGRQPLADGELRFGSLWPIPEGFGPCDPVLIGAVRFSRLCCSFFPVRSTRTLHRYFGGCM